MPARPQGKAFGLGAFALAAMLCAGCRLEAVRRQAVHIENQPEVVGRVEVPSVLSPEEHTEGAIVVALLEIPETTSAPVRVVETQQLFEPGVFSFRVPPGRYLLAGWLDTNDDFEYSAGEWVTNTAPIEVRRRQRLLAPTLTLAAETSDPNAFRIIDARPYRVGDIATLADTRFGPESGVFGVWQPMRFDERYTSGVFLLEAHDPTKIPVLFVHGMKGYPLEFATMVRRLDRERFQPWVIHYASGLPLDMVAGRLARSVDELRSRFDVEDICVVAHSMGGLVAREMISQRMETSPHRVVRSLTTVASPFGGVAAAASGVMWSPGVVPAWRDIRPGSNFLQGLYRRPLPDGLPHTLVFSYQDRGCDDSVVTIETQLREETQQEAWRIRGFQRSHSEVLTSEDVWGVVEDSLNECEGLVAERLGMIEDSDGEGSESDVPASEAPTPSDEGEDAS